MRDTALDHVEGDDSAEDTSGQRWTAPKPALREAHRTFAPNLGAGRAYRAPSGHYGRVYPEELRPLCTWFKAR
jgi:hypothetical protein